MRSEDKKNKKRKSEMNDEITGEKIRKKVCSGKQVEEIGGNMDDGERKREKKVEIVNDKVWK